VGKVMVGVIMFFGYMRCLPHILIIKTHRKGGVIKLDIKHWLAVQNKSLPLIKGFVHLMVSYPEFRNLFYYRIGGYATFIHFLYRKKPSLYLSTSQIGSGLYIQHGDASIIAAKSIGKNCWINQGVTVGYTKSGKTPFIGDRVTINAGAKVLGGIRIGNDVVIGANAVVVKDVPDNCTVVGVPAYIVKRDGIKVREELK